MGASDPDSGPHAVHQTLPIVPFHQTLLQRWGSGNIPKSVLPGTDKEWADSLWPSLQALWGTATMFQCHWNIVWLNN